MMYVENDRIKISIRKLFFLLSFVVVILVVMPSEFDGFPERAYPPYIGGTSESRRLRDLLRHVMETQNLEGSNQEWWHFNSRDWRDYRLLNIPFEMIAQ